MYEKWDIKTKLMECLCMNYNIRTSLDYDWEAFLILGKKMTKRYNFYLNF